MSDDWQRRAACRGMDPNLFFTERGESTADVRSVCQSCPVIDECAEYAVKYELLGFWGGMSERERRRQRKAQGIALVSPQSPPRGHGTDAQYQRHLRDGTEPCAACRDAHVRQQRRYLEASRLRATERRAREGVA